MRRTSIKWRLFQLHKRIHNDHLGVIIYRINRLIFSIIIKVIFYLQLTSRTRCWFLSLWKLSMTRLRTFTFAFRTSLSFCRLTQFKSRGFRSDINSTIFSLNDLTLINVIARNIFCWIKFTLRRAHCVCHFWRSSFDSSINFILFLYSCLWSSSYRLWGASLWPNIGIIHRLNFNICFWN